MKAMQFIIVSTMAISFFVGCGGSSEKKHEIDEEKRESTEQRIAAFKNSCKGDGGIFRMSEKGYHCDGKNYDRPKFSEECSKRHLGISSTLQGLLCESYLIIPPSFTDDTNNIASKLKEECKGMFIPFVMDGTHSYTCSFGINSPSNLSGWKSTCEKIGLTFKDAGISYMCVGEKSDIKDSEKQKPAQKKIPGWISFNGLQWEDGKQVDYRTVSWNEATQSCKRRGYRLPTKEEAVQASKDGIMKLFVSNMATTWTSDESTDNKAFSAMLSKQFQNIFNHSGSYTEKSSNDFYRCVTD